MEGSVSAGRVAGRGEVHQEAADDREHDGRKLGPAEAAHPRFERCEPVRRRCPAEARPQWFTRVVMQPGENAQVGLALRPRDRRPCARKRYGIRLVCPHTDEVGERVDLAAAGLPEDLAEELVAGAEVVDQHPVRRARRASELLESVGQTVLERVVGARIEDPLPDLRLGAPAHDHSFSRNGRYVYYPMRWSNWNKEDGMRVVFVHGACVKDGAWWWHRAGELLAERGVASKAPALPSCGETGEPAAASGPGLGEDVAAVRQVLTSSDEPTVVVAHSYGGIVVADAAVGLDSVRHLLLISSYLPEVGQSLSSFGTEEPAPFLYIDPADGTFTVRTEALAETFLQDCDTAIQLEAENKTARQSLAVLEQPVTSEAWKNIASTYLVCGDDRGTPAARQREFARFARSVVELDAGHHPFLSQPSAVRDLILEL